MVMPAMMTPFGMLVLELTSECNRACSFCMRQGDLRQRRFDDFGNPVRGKMPTEQCNRLLEEASQLGFKGWVTFYLVSEPYLDDRLLPMAAKAKSLGMRPFVNTNGDRLRKSPDLIKDSRQIFEFVQVGIYLPDKAKAAEDEAWWRSQLGPKAQFKRMKEIGPRPHVVKQGQTYSSDACFRPSEKMIVQYDGSCPLCCYDINTEFGLPNAFECELDAAWHHPSRILASHHLSQGHRSRYILCASCPMPAQGFPPGFAP